MLLKTTNSIWSTGIKVLVWRHTNRVTISIVKCNIGFHHHGQSANDWEWDIEILLIRIINSIILYITSWYGGICNQPMTHSLIRKHESISRVEHPTCSNFSVVKLRFTKIKEFLIKAFAFSITSNPLKSLVGTIITCKKL